MVVVENDKVAQCREFIESQRVWVKFQTETVLITPTNQAPEASIVSSLI